MNWERGREEIERLLGVGEIAHVPPSELVARRLLADADAHVVLARKGADDDPSGALQLGYDAARKASAALLAVQGLRATTTGGHIAVIEAVRAQFGLRCSSGSIDCDGGATRLSIRPRTPRASLRMMLAKRSPSRPTRSRLQRSYWKPASSCGSSEWEYATTSNPQL